MGQSLYLLADNGKNGQQLWRLDEASDNPQMITNLVSDPLSSGFKGLMQMNGELFFAANEEEHGTELWKSDGTECQNIAFVNSISGKIIDGIVACVGVKFKLNSSLLIVNPKENFSSLRSPICPTKYYIISDDKLITLKESKG